MARPTDAEIEQSILKLAIARGAGKTICPSEVARRLSRDDRRSLMPRIREVAAKLRKEGEIRVTQYGKDVDPLNPGGHIRIGLADGNRRNDQG